ncbi:MAG: PRC-barrel domain-containing protein [Candidatus Bathyarchaeota archaeon]|nr:PRC-barrel domain-containing protein [Candidatus Bathyarchaeota archaeon]
MTSVDELFGKKVIGAKGYNIGEVKGLTADLAQWRITHLQVKLDGKAAEELGFKKRFTSSTVCLPVSLVNAVGDVVTITQSLVELSNNPEIYECKP